MVIALCLTFFIGEISARAEIISWGTPTGATTSDGSVSAQADFTLSNGSLTILLTNLEQNVTSDGQNVSGITFNVTGATGPSALVTSNLGDVSTVDTSNGSYTDGVSDLLTRWEATKSGITISLTTLSGGKPNSLIIGPDDQGGFEPSLGEYSNANDSIYQHNPVVLGSASFTITIPGVTTTSEISNVVFDFGTTPESVNGVLVPEPSTLVGLLSLGLTGLVVAAYRRRRA